MRTIAHISDLHFGRHDETAAERLLANISEAQPDLVVITGDLTQRARHWQFAAARAFLEKLPAPAVVVPGNRDIPLYDVAHRFLGRLARYRRYICTELQPFFCRRRNSAAGPQHGALGHLRRRESFTQASRRDESGICESAGGPHEDPGDPSSSGGACHSRRCHPGRAGRNGAQVRDRSRRAPGAVRAPPPRVKRRPLGQCLAGDGSILLVHAGTAISTRLRGEPNSYNLLRVGPTAVTCTVRAFSGTDFLTAETVHYALPGGRWTRHQPVTLERVKGIEPSS